MVYNGLRKKIKTISSTVKSTLFHSTFIAKASGKKD